MGCDAPSDQNAASDQRNRYQGEPEEPAPVLHWMPEHADEMASVKIGDHSDRRISGGPANGHQWDILAETIVRSSSRGEDQAGRKRKRNGGGGNEHPGSPAIK